MSNMIGNPHFADHLCDHVDSNDGRAISAATLALAYEQRTANLIAVADGISTRALLRLSDDEYEEIARQLRTRLGLETS